MATDSINLKYANRTALTSRVVWALVVLLAMELIVFRSGLYNRILKPQSYAGTTNQFARRVLSLANQPHPGVIGVLGDSRVREGFSAKIFDQQQGICNRFAGLNLGVSGSTIRQWYYFLKHVDPHCTSFRYLVLALPSYFDEDYPESLYDNQTDLQSLVPVLDLNDALEFASSYNDANLKQEAIAAAFSKMFAYRRDLRDLLANPNQRIAQCKHWRVNGEKYTYDYAGRPATLAGARVDGNKIVGLPSDMDDSHRLQLQAEVFPATVDSHFKQSQYMQYWLNRLIDRYHGSGTLFFVVHVPHAPFAAQHPRPHITKTFTEVQQKSNVVAAPEDYFADLMTPELFCDHTHLNVQGRPIFTKRLSQWVISADRRHDVTLYGGNTSGQFDPVPEQNPTQVLIGNKEKGVM